MQRVLGADNSFAAGLFQSQPQGEVMANGDDKGPHEPEVISEGPAEPYHVSGKPALIGIAQALSWISDVKKKMANLEMELIELKRKLEDK